MLRFKALSTFCLRPHNSFFLASEIPNWSPDRPSMVEHRTHNAAQQWSNSLDAILLDFGVLSGYEMEAQLGVSAFQNEYDQDAAMIMEACNRA